MGRKHQFAIKARCCDCTDQQNLFEEEHNHDKKLKRTMQQPGNIQESPRYEMVPFDGNPLWRDVRAESKTSGNETRSPKPKLKPVSKGKIEREKIVEIRQLDMNFDGGDYDVIANDSKGFSQGGNQKQKPGGERHDAVYDSLSVMTQASQQQMDLFRRMMYLMTLLLVIVFLTAAASLALTVMIMMSEKSFSLNQPTPTPGRLPEGEGGYLV